MSSSQGQAAWRSRSGGGQGPASSTHQQPQPPPSVPYPPGYPNAPPVQLPPGITHQQWSQGYWRFDPNAKPVWASASAQAASGAPPITYNPGLVNNNRPDSQAGRQSTQVQQGQPPAGWMPHPGWQIPADFNPYKRVPKPPDPTYWATELSDNPLGLENMHITQQFIEEHDGHTMQTPWVWNPGNLSDEDQQPETTSDPQGRFNPTHNHRVTSASEQAARGHPHLTQPSSDAQDGDRYRQRENASSHSQSQESTVPPGQRQQQQQPSPPQSQPSNTPQRHPSLSRRHTHDSAYHTPPERSSSRRQAEPPPQDGRSRRDVVKRQKTPANDSNSSDSEDEAFSERKELHPTFSPAIVRTPKYYSERANTPVSTPNRSGSAAPVRSASEPPSSSSKGRSSAPPPLVSQLRISESDVLSPLIGATPRPSSTPMPRESVERERSSHHRSNSSLSKSRTKSPPSPPPYRQSSTVSSSQQSGTIPRSHTYPTLDPVSEDPFSSTPHDVQSSRNPPLTGSSRKTESKESSSKHARALSRSQTYPETFLSSSPTRVVSPPRSATPSRPSSRNPSRSHTPSNSGSGSSLPPPLPPDVLARMQERHPNAVPTPITVRKGFWNRRGDHLTASKKYIVYAPHNQTNPPDLARYPSPKQGFMDFDGNVVMLDQRMQELPESLPRYGQPPIRPYESFVQFERRWHPVDPITPP